MKKNLLLLLCALVLKLTQAQNVPNGGFENWSVGAPVSWYANNIPTITATITQTTPSHTGSYAVKGTVVTSPAGNVSPLIESIDMSGNGFAVTQAYSTLSFYYKTNLNGASQFTALVSMKDAANNAVAIGAMTFIGNVGSYTLATVPINYIGSNPVECSITFTVYDSTGGSPPVGDYFIVDDVGLSGLASVQENSSPVSIANVYPNPANHSAVIQYQLMAKSDVQFRIINTQGKTVREINLPEQAAGKHETDFDISSLSSGFYFVRMKTSEGFSFARLQVTR